MRLKIGTILGEFIVWASYQPTGEDPLLLQLTECINTYALPYLRDGKEPSEILALIDEGDLEKHLFNSIKAPGGAGPRVTLNLKSKEISLERF